MRILYHASRINLTIYLDHGTGIHRRLINVSELAESLGPEYCSTLLGDVFSGEDCTSAFKGKGKVNPLKKLQKNPKYQRAYSQLGELWLVTDEVQQEMESFTCTMYGHVPMRSDDAVRAKMLKKMVGADQVLDSKSKVDLERLPPPKVCLTSHVHCANFRVACYKRADQPIFERPNPYDECMGWEKTMDEGLLEPVWTIGPILPPSLVEVLAQKTEEKQEALWKEADSSNNNVDEEDGEYQYEEEDEEMEIGEIDFDDLFSDDDD